MKIYKLIKNIYVIEPINVNEKIFLKKYLRRNLIKFFEFRNYLILNKKLFNYKIFEKRFRNKFYKIVIENFLTLDTLDGMGNPVAPTQTSFGSGDVFSYVVGSSYVKKKKKKNRKKIK